MRASEPMARFSTRPMAAVLAVVVLLPGLAAAEQVKGDAALLQTLRKAQGMLRELGQDKAELDAANAALNQQVKELQARLAAAESRQAQVPRLESQLEEQRRQNEDFRRRIAGDGERLRALGARGKAMADELARWRRDNALLVHAVDERARWGNACLDKNRELIRLNRQMLKHQSGQGFWDRLKAAEPITGLGAVAEENARDEFGYRLEDLEVTPWREPPVRPSAPAEPAEDDPADDEE